MLEFELRGERRENVDGDVKGFGGRVRERWQSKSETWKQSMRTMISCRLAMVCAKRYAVHLYEQMQREMGGNEGMGRRERKTRNVQQA